MNKLESRIEEKYSQLILMPFAFALNQDYPSDHRVDVCIIESSNKGFRPALLYKPKKKGENTWKTLTIHDQRMI